ncbi:unnamed protein product [Caenorhabditis auriculariae]|uniref:CCHC-type domain-containing protein n=1 Tax=Caenorhabditis auriculariae TaxID=2777116 RepID=A0A8S1HG40_9PELO|nr:unnamed protein product [Caenorhabditis auriculariae]
MVYGNSIHSGRSVDFMPRLQSGKMDNLGATASRSSESRRRRGRGRTSRRSRNTCQLDEEGIAGGCYSCGHFGHDSRECPRDLHIGSMSVAMKSLDIDSNGFEVQQYHGIEKMNSTSVRDAWPVAHNMQQSVFGRRAIKKREDLDSDSSSKMYQKDLRSVGSISPVGGAERNVNESPEGMQKYEMIKTYWKKTVDGEIEEQPRDMNASIFFIFTILPLAYGLRCYEGTVSGLDSNLQTPAKHCGGISNYCIQRINKKTGEMRRECSSWSDEHSIEEKCPMSGCHFQSKDETFCCCQFDDCNEWRGDGTEFRAGETIAKATMLPTVSTTIPPLRRSSASVNIKDMNWNVDSFASKTTPRPAAAARKNSEIEIN